MLPFALPAFMSIISLFPPELSRSLIIFQERAHFSCNSEKSELIYSYPCYQAES